MLALSRALLTFLIAIVLSEFAVLAWPNLRRIGHFS